MAWEKFIQAGIRLPFYMHLSVEGVHESLLHSIGWRPEKWFVTIEKQLTSVYHDPADQARFAEWLLKEVVPIPESRTQFLAALAKADVELLRFCRQLYFTDFIHLDDLALRKQLEEFVRLFRVKFALYGFPKLVDGAVGGVLTSLLSQPLTPEIYTKLITGREVTDYGRERLSLLLIVRAIYDQKLENLFTKTTAEIIEQLGRFYPALYHRVENYAREFAWVPVNHHVQPFNLDQAIAAIVVTIRDKTAMLELDSHLTTFTKTRDRETARLCYYAPTENDKMILEFFRSINVLNESRKAAMSKALLWSYPLFQEIAERLQVDIVSLRQLTASEMLLALKDDAVSVSHRQVMGERLSAYACLLRNGIIEMWNGSAAERVIADELAPPIVTNEVKGVVASLGYAKGRVRLILMEYQTEQLQDGEILVTSMTDPDMVPAMKKAAAIVTDEGGLTCHASIVSRELGKPCVIATKIATKVFKDGDLVEVDAKSGVVRKINEASVTAG